MAVNSAAGSKFYIGGAFDTNQSNPNLAYYQADSYIEVGEVEDLGQFGDESAVINFASLSDSRVKKFKGPRDAGVIAVVAGADIEDDGQQAMVAAEGTSLDYNFRVVLNDQLTLGGGPSEHYFHGKVMSKRLHVGTVTNVVRQLFNVGVNSPVVIQDPT